MTTYRMRILVLLATFSHASLASAQGEYDNFNSPWRIYLGSYWSEPSSKLAINGEILPPRPPSSVEDVLGLEDSDAVLWGGISWQFKERHSIELESFALNRNGGTSGTFAPPIEVGDFFIESGEIRTFYDTSLTRLTYGFSVMRSERMDFQLKAGLHIAKLAAGVQLGGNICTPATVPSMPPGCPPAGSEGSSEDVTAPLPHLGVSYAYAFTPTLWMTLQAVGFAIEIDSIDGSIVELDADVAWHPFDHVGFGAGLRYFNTNVKSGTSTLNGEFDFEYIGPTVYFQATF